MMYWQIQAKLCLCLYSYIWAVRGSRADGC